jgi:hypothetical protein
MFHPLDLYVISETWNAKICDSKIKKYAVNEFYRLLLSQHENVIQVYASTITKENSLVIVIDRAKNGDLV